MQFAEIKANINFQKFIILQKIVISIGNGECWVILHASQSPADFFQNQLFRKFLSGIPSECQAVWVQIRPDICRA